MRTERRAKTAMNGERSKSAQIRETFRFAHSMEQIFATEKHRTALHGTCLWDLISPEAQGFLVPGSRSTNSNLAEEALSTGIQSLDEEP